MPVRRIEVIEAPVQPIDRGTNIIISVAVFLAGALSIFVVLYYR
jgi:hypothetical protein